MNRERAFDEIYKSLPKRLETTEIYNVHANRFVQCFGYNTFNDLQL